MCPLLSLRWCMPQQQHSATSSNEEMHAGSTQHKGYCSELQQHYRHLLLLLLPLLLLMQVLREVVADYWPAVNNTLYGASCDRNCLASTSNWPEAAADACGCNPKLISEFKRFAKFDPSNTNMANRKPNTFDCLKQLTATRITIFSYRAALQFCFQASALQTGNGLGWRPATDDGYEPGFYGLLSFPEFVMPNYAVRYMRKVGRMQQLPAL